MIDSYKLAYVSRITYPKSVAHAQQSLLMAAAFARVTGDTHFFVRGVAQTGPKLDVQDSPLQIWSLHTERIPDFIRGYYGHAAVYNSLVAAILAFHLKWMQSSKRKVLFNRGLKEYPYWGLVRPYLPWLRDWLLIYEAHDIAGLDDLAFGKCETHDGSSTDRHIQRRIRALQNHDLVLCVTQALANDLQNWSNGVLHPHVVRHASPLTRLATPPEVRPSGETVILGYMGTIDRERGVDTLLKAMRLLPAKFRLRLVGLNLNHGNDGTSPNWLTELMADPEIKEKVELISRVPLSQVMQEIDRCDILLQPASDDIISLRYRAPLKLFDYMVRGKPILAADVPCHREMLQDGVNACFYRLNDVTQLVERIQFLANQPRLMESIACKAWEQSADYTYDARARRILELVDEVWERRYAEEHRNAQ